MKNRRSVIRYFLIILLVSIINSTSMAQNWLSLGGGTDDYVNAVTYYNGNLYVGGGFTTAGSATMKYITFWDGSSWHSVGGGLNGQVDALVVYNGELIVGGRFTSAGGSTANYIAKWNGSSWSTLGNGMDNYVTCLAVYGSNLIAGGFFTMATIPVSRIAQWNGSTWSALGSGTGGPNPQVMALGTYNGDLIAGGAFTTAGGSSAAHIAKWNGSSWSALASGLDNTVYSLKAFAGKLHIGGSFSHAGSVSANGIVSWNGTSYSALGSGISGGSMQVVNAIDICNNRLIVGGAFQNAGWTEVNSIARWDGFTWSGLQDGVTTGNKNGYVNALTVNGNTIIAGGGFDSAGSVYAGNVALWTEVLSDENMPGSESPQFYLAQNNPNPVQDQCKITFNLVEQGHVHLGIYDLSGKLITVLRDEKMIAGEHTVAFQVKDYSPGFYIYRLEHNNQHLQRRMIVLGDN